MSAPLTREEIRKRDAVLRAHPELRAAYAEQQARKERVNRVSVTVGKVEWSNPAPPLPPPLNGGAVRHLPVEKHMLSERVWISQHALGEKA